MENMEKITVSFKEYIKNEMMLLTKLGKEDPKSYEIWYHRYWMIKQTSHIEKVTSKDCPLTEKIIGKDLEVCELFLNKDERNFHVWNYRLQLV